MSTDFQAFSNATHPIIKLEDDYNNILDHGLDKGLSFIMRKNGSNYEAIDGATGKLATTPNTDGYTVLNSILGSNRTIFFKAGTTYTMDTRLMFNGVSHLTFLGENRSAVLQLGDGVDHHLISMVNSSHDINLLNLGLDGNGSNQTTWSSIVKLYSDSYNINIRHCEIKNAATTGIDVGSGSTDFHDVWIIDNNIHDCGLITAGDAIGLEPAVGYYAYNFRIGLNHIYNTNRYGIMLYNRSKKNLVYKNYITNTGQVDVNGDAIRLYGATENEVEGNIIHDVNAVGTSATGIGVWSSSHKNTVRGNKINTYYRGIWVSASEENNITSNTIDTCTYGIGEVSGATLNKIRNNSAISTVTTPYTFLSKDIGGNDIDGVPDTNWGTATGTGSEQTIAHGIYGTPSYVETRTQFGGSGDAAPDQTDSPDATNIYITANNGKPFYWLVRKR